jgi:hypothetical protein
MNNDIYAKPTQVVPTYYNPNLPVDSRQLSIPPQQTPGTLIPQPPQKPQPTVYERTVGMRFRYAIIAGLLFLIFSLPVAYKFSNNVWSIFSSIPLIGKSSLVPTIIQHPNGYQVQQMVEKPCGIGIKAMAVHAVVVAVIMYIILSRNS